MSVNSIWIIAMRMLPAMTPLGASVVPATLALRETESTVVVSSTLFLVKKQIINLHVYNKWKALSISAASRKMMIYCDRL